MISLLRTAVASLLVATIAPSQLPPHSSRTAALATADVDGDGDIDLFVANSRGEANVLLLGDGKGGFSLAKADSLPVSRESTVGATFADLDGDGDQDLVCANYDVGSQLYLNDGSGRFTAAAAGAWPSNLGGDYTVVVFDTDGDGDLDVVFGSVSDPSVEKYAGLRLYQNGGKGQFVDATPSNLVKTFRTVSIAVGDINGDGSPDMVCGSGETRRGRTTRVYFNDGMGGFTEVSRVALDVTHYGAQTVCLVDLDDDGDLDLVTGTGINFRRPCVMYENNGKGVFSEAFESLSRSSRGAIDIHAVDVDGDGDLDLMTCRFALRLYLRQADGRYTRSEDWLEDDMTASVLKLIDVNGDGALDLIGGRVGQNWLRLNNGKGQFKRSLTPSGR